MGGRNRLACAAVEEVFVNDNPQSTLKLAHARGVVLLGCARGGLTVAEYAPRLVKKAIVGTGGAAKEQGQAMLRVLLHGPKVRSEEGRVGKEGGSTRRYRWSPYHSKKKKY